MPRGGRRKGLPGVAHAQRTDLNVPAAAPTGTYGAKAEAMRSQRALPMARPSTDQVSTTSPVSSRPVPPAMPAVMPGQVTPLDAPSQRPGEPVTAGLPMGAGPGVEALGLQQPAGEDFSDVLPYLPMLEFMANQPGASTQTRNFVRRLRGAKPTGA